MPGTVPGVVSERPFRRPSGVPGAKNSGERGRGAQSGDSVLWQCWRSSWTLGSELGDSAGSKESGDSDSISQGASPGGGAGSKQTMKVSWVGREEVLGGSPAGISGERVRNLSMLSSEVVFHVLCEFQSYRVW